MGALRGLWGMARGKLRGAWVVMLCARVMAVG